jgi:hypothetical protein
LRLALVTRAFTALPGVGRTGGTAGVHG